MPRTKPTALRSSSKTKKSELTSKISFARHLKPEEAYPFDWPDPPVGAEPPIRAEDIDADAPLAGQAYEDRYVLFIDILGFTELIRRSAGDDPPLHANVSTIFSALNQARDGKDGESDVRTHTFSDFVVVSAPATDSGLTLVMRRAWEISRDWLSKSLLSRGAITRGKVLHVTNVGGAAAVVFGPAFVDAYALESKVAEFPRVILSKRVRLDWEKLCETNLESAKVLGKLVSKCEDGPSCISTFSDIPANGFHFFGSHHPEEWLLFKQAITHHLDDAADTPAWYKKTRWLATEFNAAVSLGSDPSLLVSLTY